LSWVLFDTDIFSGCNKKVFQSTAKPKTVDRNQLFPKTNLPIYQPLGVVSVPGDFLNVDYTAVLKGFRFIELVSPL
jgi:hypothetical protein